MANILAKDPDDYTALCQKAQCHYQLREFQAAYEATKIAIVSQPESEWAYRLQSLTFTANGEHQRALVPAKIAVEKEPFAFETHQTLFYAQVHFGLLEEAKKSLDTVLALSPNKAAAHIASGFLQLKEKDLALAEVSFREALALDPESIDALNDLGIVYLEMANNGLGEKYRKLSAEMFERAIKADPSFRLAQKNLKVAQNKPLRPDLRSGFFALLLFIASSPLQVILYNEFSDQHDAGSSIIDLFSPGRGDAGLVSLNFLTLVSFLTLFAFAAQRRFGAQRKGKLRSLLDNRALWKAFVVGSPAAIGLYIVLVAINSETTNFFPGIAFRLWFILLIISTVRLIATRPSDED